jgi:hypothetical protein
MDEHESRDDFTGNPWHPFLRVLRQRVAKMPTERRSLPIAMPGGGAPLGWDDLFRLDAAVGRLIPARDLNEAEVRALASWLGLENEEHATFLQLGTAFLAQRDSIRQIRADPGLTDDEETALREGTSPRPTRPEPPAAVDERPAAEETIPGMETATTARDCLHLLCSHRQIDLEWLARAIAKRAPDFDSRAIFLQLRGTLPVIAEGVLEAALTILNAPLAVAAQARAFNAK